MPNCVPLVARLNLSTGSALLILDLARLRAAYLPSPRLGLGFGGGLG